MRQNLERNTKWKYFINLTGQEFPLKTNKELVRIFTALRGANDITGTTNQ
jgi:beta-1,3-galactosyl-O-glycosyl-glycoprotein beta-1,6-N-acetylglucosaminyltransferase/N-acetyllactosaminide beta-1,6-N-acetylglucosaminyltransferase